MWPPGPPWVCCVFTTSIWWSSTAVNTRLYGSLGQITPRSWWTVWITGNLEHSVSPRPSSRKRAVFQKERSYPLMIAELCFKIPSLCCDPSTGAAKGSKTLSCLPPRFHAPLDLLDPLNQAARVFSTRLSLVPCSTQNWHLLLYSALLRHFFPLKLFFLPSTSPSQESQIVQHERKYSLIRVFNKL